MVQEATGSGTTETMNPPVAVEPAKPEMTDAQRDELAAKLVDRFSLWSGAAGLIPVPIVDMAAVGGVQIQMLRKLSAIYGVPFSVNQGKSVIAALAGAAIPASTASTTASAVKSVPVVGTAIGTLAMPAFSAGATYLIGKVFIQHFASGGTLLDFNPPDYREFIKTQKDKLGARFAKSPPAQPTTTAAAPAESTTSTHAGEGSTATSA